MKTRPPAPSSPRPRRPVRLAAARAALGLLWAAAACSSQQPVPAAAPAGERLSEDADAAATPRVPRAVGATVASLDGSLRIVLPAELIVHRLAEGVMGTSADGGLRVYIGRGGDADDLIRVAGPLKDTLLARGWESTGERHFERAVRLAFRRGSDRVPGDERAIWLVARTAPGVAAGPNTDPDGDADAGGTASTVLVTCEGTVDADSVGWLEAPFESLCQSVELLAP